MDLGIVTAPLTLHRGQLIAMLDAQGARIECLEGELWITQDADGADYHISRGEGFTVTRAGLTLAQATCPGTRVVLSARATEVGGALRSWTRALAWLKRARRPRPAVPAA
ncbi:MAG: DUF2917 domain-containing protein [Pseudomonadota bacterium]